MFRSQFKLTAKEERGLCDLCVFVVRIYLKAWITAPLASSAPNSDLMLLKSLLDYSEIHSVISQAASAKFSKHLWYLSKELVCLALFDSQVSTATKRLMVNALQNVDSRRTRGCDKRITVDLQLLRDKNLKDFVTLNSKRLFKMLGLPDGFLAVDPELWKERDDFLQATETVSALSVTNDHAERGVSLIHEFSGLIAHDEPRLQFLLQVVEEHRRAYPDSRKQTLAGGHTPEQDN